MRGVREQVYIWSFHIRFLFINLMIRIGTTYTNSFHKHMLSICEWESINLKSVQYATEHARKCTYVNSVPMNT